MKKNLSLKKNIAAAKADIKRQEFIVKWQNKKEDVEMAVPLVTGKRKTKNPLTSEAKTKKEN